MKHRDVDLVIRNEKHMEMLIKFLIYTLKTADGSKGSAAELIQRLTDKLMADDR